MFSLGMYFALSVQHGNIRATLKKPVYSPVGEKMMHTHKLILEGNRSKAEWLLEWDDSALTLKAPDGELVFDAPADQAHRAIEIFELYAEQKISFATPNGPLTFRQQKPAATDVREYVENGLRSDPEYCTALLRQSRAAITRCIVMFILGAIPFALYCWWASWAPDPSAGHWLRPFKWLVHLALLGLLGLTLGGFFGTFFGLKQMRRLRQIERGIVDSE